MTSVRGHTRRTSSGRTTRVRQHRRRGLVSPRHSWGLLLRAFRAGRARRRVTAAGLGLLGLVELAAWLTLTGTALILATAAVLCGVGAFLAAQAGGVRAPGRRRPPERGGGA